MEILIKNLIIVEEIEILLSILENSHASLTHLLEQIDPARYSQHRLEGKWSIHDQVCHLADAQVILHSRFQQFIEEDEPEIRSYDPGNDRTFSDRDMESEIDRYRKDRIKMVGKLREQAIGFWNKQGTHPAFHPYGSRVLLNHCLNVDYAHFFSVEQLGLTKNGMEDQILTLP